MKVMTKLTAIFWKLPAINNEVWYTKENSLIKIKALQITKKGSL
jgi:hypothetical protein